MPTLSKQPLIILGPTASGKTELGVQLARLCNGEILSADSRQIYFGMNIGTAKACSRDTLHQKHTEPITYKKVPHYLIDILSPTQQYSAAEFRKDALQITTNILARNRLPIIVGGTGFYIRVLTGDRLIPNVPPDAEFRAWTETQSIMTLLSELHKIDPETTRRVRSFDHRRITRALEIARSKKDIPTKPTSSEETISFRKFAILPDRDGLRQRIKQRTNMMFANGLIDEVKGLIQTYGKDAPGLQAIGYREVIPLIEGTISEQEAIDAVFHATWQYARRQMVWLKKEPQLTTVKTPDEAVHKILNS